VTPDHAHHHRLDYRLEPGPPGDDRPPLVFLHEGLGSVELWRTFPDQVRAAAGEPTTLVYSRAGYGRSSPVEHPWPVGYMHREALEVLPEVLARLGLERPVLIGHSDGASIALLHAGSGHPVAGLVLLAPHVFVEDVSVAGIAAAGAAYPSTGLRERLARYHDDVDGVFWGWNDVWRSSAFRDWNIEPFLFGIEVPVLAIQGDADEYGTLAQLDAIEAGVRGPFERLVVAGGGHVLHTGDARQLVDAVSRFVRSLR
jgi:pimeloyl-ACP methyl ester carboxylesterase